MRRSVLFLSVVLVSACSAAQGTPSVAPPASAKASPLATPAVVPATTPPTSGPVGPWIVYMTGGISRVQADGSQRSEIIKDGLAHGAGHPDIAPDGRVVFQAGVTGSWDIWIADADGQHQRVLVDCVAPCDNDDGPAWSPDGTKVAFARLDAVGDQVLCKLQIIDVASGEITTVAEPPNGESASGPRWSPDGTKLVVAYEDHHGPNGTLVDNPVDSRIATIDLTAPAAGFTFLTPKGMEASYPDWHPTDDVIVFQAGPKVWWKAIKESGGNIFMVRADGSELRQLTHLGPDDRAIWMPAWTADGSAIFVTLTVRATLDNRLASMLPDGTGLADLPGPIGGAHARQQRVSG